MVVDFESVVVSDRSWNLVLKLFRYKNNLCSLWYLMSYISNILVREILIKLLGAEDKRVYPIHTYSLRALKSSINIISGPATSDAKCWRVQASIYFLGFIVINLIIKRVQGCSQSDALKWVTCALFIFSLTCTGVQKVRSKKANCTAKTGARTCQ